MSVTDKELLTFCNLTNLKMEYAKLTYEQEILENRERKIISRNHTIYSLIKWGYRNLK